MSIVPPPPPPVTPPNQSASTLDWRGGRSLGFDDELDDVRANSAPIVVSVLSFILGSAVLFFGNQGELLYPIIGYFFTPLVPAMCVFWDSVSQRKKSQEVSYFIRNFGFQKALKTIALLAYGVGVFQCFNLARDLASVLARGQ